MARSAQGQARRRCAIYTRKSSEEGLQQAFNSLDAQREACQAFIRSQRHEGWIALAEPYDDGGRSGATLERPALQRLLADVAGRRIDAVVVYKVDRLTRSLGDFAKIVEVFDRHGVSFVSVTQQFNTTSSMGRLTLNMLLSFAQFEREVTGERIRDKIAASKKKGLWMGGLPPLGYDVAARKLVVNQAEAARVRQIFHRYAALGSVRALKEELDQAGLVSKRRSDRHGRPIGGTPLTRGALYRMLQNRIYRGEIVHKDKSYPGEHAAIIDEALWDRVQTKLAANRIERRGGIGVREPSLLAGLLFDAADERMTATHASKQGRRYRYYISQSLIKRGRPKAADAARRVPAETLERLVKARLIAFLKDAGALYDALASQRLGAHEIETLVATAARHAVQWPELPSGAKRRWLRALIARITLNHESVEIALQGQRLAAILRQGEPSDAEASPGEPEGPITVLTVAARLQRTGLEKRLVIDAPAARTGAGRDTSLLKLIARAQELQAILLRGERPIAQMAAAAGLSSSYFTRLVRLSFLSPKITRTILHGDQPVAFTARKLMADTRLPLEWQAQRAHLGFP